MRVAAHAQNRYLFLMLLASGYTLATHLTPGDVVQVPFLGLAVPRPLVEAFAVSFLGTLMLAFLGSSEAMYINLTLQAPALGVDMKALSYRELSDPEPNLLDFLGYSTFINGQPTLFTPFGWAVLYSLPLIATVGWAIWLWRGGIETCCGPWRWLIAVHVFNGAILLLVSVRLLPFLYSHWRPQKNPRE